MSQEQSEAVVLRAVDFSETSRIITFLTPGRGKLTCMVSGMRRARNPWGNALDQFHRVELVYYFSERRSVQRLTEASIIDAYAGLRANLEKTAYAAFPLELVYRTAQENEPSDELFAALTNGLSGMASWQGDVRTHAVWQVVHLLAAAGFDPALSEEERRLPRRERALLAEFAAAPGMCPAVDDSGNLFPMLRLFAARHLETQFYSLRVLDQIFKR